ncbi:MAG: DJ-1/PfpI family protein [Ruminococcaceae bacterium]|nr:DJ-1/PfpI family protein [Oscillospiraceae bacterium]
MVLEFLADGFEEIEALCPLDLLRRAGVEVKTVSLRNDRKACGAHGIVVESDITADEAKKLYSNSAVDMIILPGGMPGAKNLDESEIVDLFVNKAVADGAYIASICAAPMVPGKRGLLSGRRATCYPGFDEYLIGADYTGGRVEVDGNMITGCGMGAAEEFGLALVRLMKGDADAEKLRTAILAK